MIKTSATLFLLLFNMFLFSQKFNGKIIYNLDIDLPEELEPQRSMLPTEMTTFIGKKYSRIVQKTKIGDQVTIINHKTNEITSLINLMGQKIAIAITPESQEETNNPTIVYNDETREIAGYTCFKAIYSIYDKNQQDTISTVIYYTPEISSKANGQFKDLKGLPLEYSIDTQGMHMHLKALSIINEKYPKSMFIIPNDYEIMSIEDFQKMMEQ